MSGEMNKLTADTEITETGHQSLLLTNLQKLEAGGKVASPNREVVTAKDIVSGIISAANQKMLRANKNKKDSVDSGNVAKYQSDVSPASRYENYLLKNFDVISEQWSLFTNLRNGCMEQKLIKISNDHYFLSAVHLMSCFASTFAI